MNLEHVRIRLERRADRTLHIVEWTPAPNTRHRRAFVDPSKARPYAERIEKAMRAGRDTFSPAEEKEFRAALTLRDQLAPGVLLVDMVKKFVQQNRSKLMPITTDTAGQAFIESRTDEERYSKRHRQTVRQHIIRFIHKFAPHTLQSITAAEIDTYLKDTIGGAAKTRYQHLITLRSFFNWARKNKEWLPYDRPTAAELVEPPKVSRTEHEVYTPEEFMRILVFTPPHMLCFFLLGQFAGVRSEERLRMCWSDWRAEDNKFVLNAHITKTSERRVIDVQPNLAEWLFALRGAPDEHIVSCLDPFDYTGKIFKSAGIPSKNNALRAGFASYHLALFEDTTKTAEQDGHSVAELNKTYKTITGVTKQRAKAMFDITPQRVIEYAIQNKLPQPSWAEKFPTVRVA